MDDSPASAQGYETPLEQHGSFQDLLALVNVSGRQQQPAICADCKATCRLFYMCVNFKRVLSGLQMPRAPVMDMQLAALARKVSSSHLQIEHADIMVSEIQLTDAVVQHA